VAIAYQPVTAPDPIYARPISTRPDSRRSQHGRVAVELPSRAWTTLRIVGLVATTAMCVAILSAVVVGTALFALLNYAR
jgi:hypothetical protein